MTNLLKKSAIFVSFAAMVALGACKHDDQKSTWDDYADWREVNDQWLAEQAALRDADGEPLFTRVVPRWNKNAYVLMRWFNDTALTANNLRPLYTSTIDVKYIGKLCTDEPFDSSYVSTSPADSIARFQISGLVNGWAIAMERMHVGDTVEVIMPFSQGYGANKQGKIKPYSALKFGIKLVDVAGEYIRP